MQIDKNSHTPLYRQVQEVLEEKIITKQWEVGYQLPTEQELAAHFDVSTITVKRAIIELVNKGYLYRQSGKGTFVEVNTKEHDMKALILSSDDVEEDHPHELISFTIENTEVEVAGKFGLKPNAKIYKIKRLKIEKDMPVAMELTYLPVDKCPNLAPEDINNELIYNLLKKKYHISLRKARLFIKPYIAVGEMAERLQIATGSPVFEWERFTYTKQGEVIEYSKFYFRQDKFSYYTEINL